jgi:hypothetical protein
LLFFGQKGNFWISLHEKLQSEFERVSIASLNILQDLFGVRNAFPRHLDF